MGSAEPTGGTGLAGLAKRVASVDGTLPVDSPVGGPTVITVELPCVR
ncbi:two-component system sensor kinase [Frankia sp. AgKG'84/4]|nr:two-component system sensor kinase [Frankia sp. AgKG'84/4]MCL9792893.1 two-component system sensor kinase [Frankia sp. AgKG'84/4]